MTEFLAGLLVGALPMAALWRRAARELRRRPIVVAKPRPASHVRTWHPPYDWEREARQVAS